jgi:iron complex outermembrane receptor protein
MVKLYAFLAATFALMAAPIPTFASAQAVQHDSIVKDTARKTLRSYKFREEVRIYGETPEQRRFRLLTKTFNATDDVLEQVEGVSMMRRANFALEPTIRGYNAGQVAVVIDGMKMHSACVDRMDPVTAYIEIENLKQLEVSKGASDFNYAQTLGGVMNFITTKPDFRRPFSAVAEMGFEGVSNLWRARGEANIAPEWLQDGENSGIAARMSLSVKRSGDYSAGNRTLIPRSNFEKENFKVDIAKRFGEHHSVNISGIIDFARNVGYPGLIMDTKETRSYIWSIDYKAQNLSRSVPLLTAKLYMNQVLHWMDDYRRTQQEIRERVVMPDMYMPMYGDNRTTGFLGEALLTDGAQTLKLTADVFQLNAFADMAMVSIFPDVAPMYLLNIGDVWKWNYALAAEWFRPLDFVADHLSLRVNVRADYSDRDIFDTFAKQQFEGYWGERPTRAQILAASASAVLQWQATDETMLNLRFARASRMPTHIETHGYYLYNPMDNAIYIGNNLLQPERAWQAEVATTFTQEAVSMRLTGFANWIDNYIAGLTFIEANPNNRLFSQAFRRYDHVGRAFIGGVEASARAALAEDWELRGTLTWQEGRALDLQDWLPFMPPLQGNVRLQWHGEVNIFGKTLPVWSEVGARFAASQNQPSTKILLEDATPAWIIGDVRFGATIFARCDVRFGVENVLDTFYHEHFAINNLPSRGRNVYVNVAWRF